MYSFDTTTTGMSMYDDIMKKPEYKPLLYTTTVRNPERYKDFMFVLKKFDKEILNENL
jgi:hypothetical protein